MNENHDEYLDFGELCRRELGMQCQYGSYYLEGIGGRPNLGAGLRFIEKNPGNYHSIRIHKDDWPIFVERVRRNQQGGSQ